MQLFRFPFLLALTLLVTACQTAPVTGRKQLMLVPESQAIQASTQAYAEVLAPIKKQGKLNDDPAMKARVDKITARLVAQAIKYRPETESWDWQVAVIDDPKTLNAWCMAACYSTDEDGTVRLPFDPATSELVPEVWERWLAWDPVRMVAKHADAVRSLAAIYIDAGKKDEWFLDLGAEAFRRALVEIGVTDVYFELFDATHMAIEYRYPLGIRYLAERLSP